MAKIITRNIVQLGEYDREDIQQVADYLELYTIRESQDGTRLLVSAYFGRCDKLSDVVVVSGGRTCRVNYKSPKTHSPQHNAAYLWVWLGSWIEYTEIKGGK